MVPCIWYVSKIALPWERVTIGNMGAALKARGLELSIYTDGGTTGLCVDGTLSWKALTGLERLRLILSTAGGLWHLWGEPPLWWSLVRLRSRTVHTSWNPTPDWKGHPSRLFIEQAGEGETVIKPTFESRLTQAEESDDVPSQFSHAIYVNLALATPALSRAVAALKGRVVDLGGGASAQTRQRAVVLSPGTGPRRPFMPLR